MLEVVRMIADRFADAAEGVNAHLAALPRDVGDAIPPNVTVYDETRHGWVARSQAPRTDAGVVFPALTVAIEDPVEFDGDPQYSGLANERFEDVDVSVAVRLFVQNVDTEEGTEDAYYTLRAIRGCLKDFMKGEYVAARTRNSVRINQCTGMTSAALVEQLEDVWVTGGLTARFKVHESSP